MKLGERLLYLCHEYAVMAYFFMAAAGVSIWIYGKRTWGLLLLTPLILFFSFVAVVMFIEKKKGP